MKKKIKHEDWELLDVSDLAPYHDKRWPKDKYGEHAEERGHQFLNELHDLWFGTKGYNPYNNTCTICHSREAEYTESLIIQPALDKPMSKPIIFSSEDVLPI